MNGFIAMLTFDNGEQVQFRVSRTEATKNDGTFRNLFEARIEEERRRGRVHRLERPNPLDGARLWDNS